MDVDLCHDLSDITWGQARFLPMWDKTFSAVPSGFGMIFRVMGHTVGIARKIGQFLRSVNWPRLWRTMRSSRNPIQQPDPILPKTRFSQGCQVLQFPGSQHSQVAFARQVPKSLGFGFRFLTQVDEHWLVSKHVLLLQYPNNHSSRIFVPNPVILIWAYLFCPQGW